MQHSQKKTDGHCPDAIGSTRVPFPFRHKCHLSAGNKTESIPSRSKYGREGLGRACGIRAVGMTGAGDATLGRSVPQRGAGDRRRRACSQATATRPVLAVCTLPASASDSLTLNPGYVGPPPRPPGFASPVFGNRLKTNRVARGHHGLPVSSKTLPLPSSRWPAQVYRGSPMSSAAAPAGLSSGAREVTGEPIRSGPGPPEQARYPAARAPARLTRGFLKGPRTPHSPQRCRRCTHPVNQRRATKPEAGPKGSAGTAERRSGREGRGVLQVP